MRTVSLVVLVFLLATGHPGAAGSHLVVFRTGDGRTVEARVTEPVQTPVAALVLVPMSGRPKDDWQSAAQRFADANILTVAIDGSASPVVESEPGTAMPSTSEQGLRLRMSTDDVRAAVGYLGTRADVRSAPVGVVGASLGATVAVDAAASDPRVRALALISPSLEYRGVPIEPALRQYGGRPVLLVASRLDPYAVRTVRRLSKDATGPREEQWSDTMAHGTVLISREPELVQIMASWFLRVLAAN